MPHDEMAQNLTIRECFKEVQHLNPLQLNCLGWTSLSSIYHNTCCKKYNLGNSIALILFLIMWCGRHCVVGMGIFVDLSGVYRAVMKSTRALSGTSPPLDYSLNCFLNFDNQNKIIYFILKKNVEAKYQ